jgi:tetratricopeptide (TPR) repeat protein
MDIKDSNTAYQRMAVQQFEEALAIYTELNDRPGQALMLQHLGHCYKALRQPARAAGLFERALAMQAPGHSVPAFQSVFTNEKIRSFYHPESFLGARRPRNVPLRSVRVLHPYRAPEQSAFCWGAVPCPFSPTGLAPWVLARMEHIRRMDYPAMQQQMLDFVDMVIDLSAQQRRKKRAYSHIDSSKPELWPLSQVALECRQSVEFWTVFSTVLDYFSELPAGPQKNNLHQS